jgi:hypothetical protein
MYKRLLPMNRRKQWVEACAARLISKGEMDPAAAARAATDLAENEAQLNGSEIDLWAKPRKAADIEMKSWPGK